MKALYKQDIEEQVEIIVIDNGSADFNIEKWKDDHPNVLWELNDLKRNPYTSRNMGAIRAKGEYLVFIDAKCQPQGSWLRKMIASADPKHPVVAGHYKLHYQSDVLKDKVYGMLYLNNDKNVRKGYGVTAGNLLVDRKFFQDVGPFKDEKNSGNDIEWSLRALKSGYKIGYASEAIINYPAQTWIELSHSVKKYAKGVAALNESKQPSMRSFLPMRSSTFTNHLTHRALQNLSISDKLKLWRLTWIMKVKFAIELAKSREKQDFLSLNNSK